LSEALVCFIKVNPRDLQKDKLYIIAVIIAELFNGIAFFVLAYTLCSIADL